MPYFEWCELDNELKETDIKEIMDRNAEGSWNFTGLAENGVVTFSTDRHVTYICRAASLEEAHAKFLKEPIYLEYSETEA